MNEKTPDGYLSQSGVWRRWRYPDAIRPGWKNGEPVGAPSCDDCGVPYAHITDVVLPHELWERINPSMHRGAGTLCPNCMFERLHYIGVFEVTVS